MRQAFLTWESLLRGAMVLLIIFWMRPGIRAAMKKTEMQNRIGGRLIMPLDFVMLFFVCNGLI